VILTFLVGQNQSQHESVGKTGRNRQAIDDGLIDPLKFQKFWYEVDAFHLTNGKIEIDEHHE